MVAPTIHTIFYTDKAIARPLGLITIAAGKRKCVRLPFQNTGRVFGLHVWQRSGTSVAFSVDLFDCDVPFAEGGDVAYNAAAGDVAAALPGYRVVSASAITAGAGNTASAIDACGWLYQNQNSPVQSVKQTGLYLVITPTNAPDESTWCAKVQISMDV